MGMDALISQKGFMQSRTFACAACVFFGVFFLMRLGTSPPALPRSEPTSTQSAALARAQTGDRRSEIERAWGVYETKSGWREVPSGTRD